MLNLKVTNYRKIKNAEITISPIALIGGFNAQGKTSLSEAAQTALIKDFKHTPAGTKKNAGVLLNRDNESEAGVVTLTKGDNYDIVKLPSGTIAGENFKADIITSGISYYQALPEADKTEYLQIALKAKLDKTYFFKWMQSYLGDLPDWLQLTESEISAVWAKIEKSSFDVEHISYSVTAKDSKRKWESHTGAKWGSKIAFQWQPVNSEHIVFEKTNPKQAVENYTKQLQEAQKTSQADKYKTEIVASLLAQEAELRESLQKAELAVKLSVGNVSQSSKVINEIEADIRANGSPLTCAHCGVDNYLINGKLSATALKQLPQADIDNLPSFKSDLERFQNELQKAEAELNEIRPKIALIDEAKKWLAANQETGKADADLESLQTHLSYYTALKYAREVVLAESLANALSKKGAQKSFVAEVISDFSETILATYAKTLDLGQISFDEDLNILLNGYSYAELSASTKLLVNACIQYAFAKLLKHDLVIIDGADILHYPKRRERLLKLAKSAFEDANTHSIITMSFADRNLMPNLQKAGLGNSYWLENGEIL